MALNNFLIMRWILTHVKITYLTRNGGIRILFAIAKDDRSNQMVDFFDLEEILKLEFITKDKYFWSSNNIAIASA